MQPLAGGLAPLGVARGVAGNGLLNNLIAYWPLNEAAGANNALDLHSNALHLTQNSSPGSAAGKVYAGARTFDGANDYFSRASASLTPASSDFTVACWVWSDAVSIQLVICLDDAGGRNYRIYHTAGGVSFFSYVAGATTARVTGFTTGVWHLLIAWRDHALNETHITLNNGAPGNGTSGAFTTTPTNFLIGRQGFTLEEVWNGRIGPVAMWKSAPGGGGVLSEAQRLALWNGGAGLPYASFTA